MKKIIILFLVLCVLLCNIGSFCFAEEETITIYLPEDDMITVDAVVRGIVQLKKTHPDIQVEIEYLPSIWFDSEYSTRLTTELMAQSGPDIIVMNSTTFPDVYKAMRSNLFVDLNTYISKDETFRREDYIEPALDAGVMDGHQYMMPIYIMPSMLTTTQRILDTYGLSNPQYTENTMLTLLEPLTKTDAPAIFQEMEASVINLPSFSGIQMVDYETMASNMQIDELRTFFELLQKIYQRDYSPVEGAYYGSTIDGYVGLTEMNFIYDIEDYSFHGVLANAALLSNEDQPVVIPLPTVTGGIHANIGFALAINAHSTKQDAAYALIQAMLSPTVQYPGSIDDRVASVPVNKTQWDTCIQTQADYSSRGGYGSDGTFLEATPISQEIMEELYTLPDKITDCGMQNFQVLTMWLESMQPYYEEVRGLDASFNELQFKLELYAGE